MRKLICSVALATLLVVPGLNAAKENAKRDGNKVTSTLGVSDGTLETRNLRVDPTTNELLVKSSASAPMTIAQPVTVVGADAVGASPTNPPVLMGGADASGLIQIPYVDTAGRQTIGSTSASVDGISTSLTFKLISPNGNSGYLGTFGFGYDVVTDRWDRLRADTTDGLWVNVKASVPVATEPQSGSWLRYYDTFNSVGEKELLPAQVGVTYRIIGYTITCDAASGEAHGSIHWTNTETTGVGSNAFDHFDSSPEGGLKEQNDEQSRLRATGANVPLYMNIRSLTGSAVVYVSVRYVEE